MSPTWGQDEEIIDYGRLRAQRERMRKMVEGHIARQRFIRHVEIRDRFGVRLLIVEGGPGSIPGAARIDPVDWTTLRRRTIRVPLLAAGIRPEGEVLLGFLPQALDDEVLQRIEGLRVKTWIAGVMALGLLVLASFYVVHLIRKNRRLEQARQSAARASYVGLLASGLAHEIRNPLNAMNMNLQMLEEELQLAEPEQAELLDSTKSEIKRLERLVNNFLSYAHPSPARFELRDLNEVVGELVRLLDADFRQSEVELLLDPEPLLPQVAIDETQLKQALINLMVNARQVLCNGGTVTVRTRAGSQGEAVIEIVDDGPGIAEAVQQRIFDVFYSSRGGGTGLGLPIAKADRRASQGHHRGGQCRGPGNHLPHPTSPAARSGQGAGGARRAPRMSAATTVRRTAERRAAKLQREIAHHRKRYYVDDDPEISDAWVTTLWSAS